MSAVPETGLLLASGRVRRRKRVGKAVELAATAGSFAAVALLGLMVGSVVVKDGEIVGRGYHRYDNLKHAEVWALEEAGPRARGATVYVNLEPCSHRGGGKRTSPCVQALLDAGVTRVVASMVDPNPRVNGRGFDRLREAGIEVGVGALEREARRLNEKYARFVTSGLPFVHLKLACSLDGRIATRAGDARWITGAEARAASQALRHDYDAILVGVGTVLADDPHLTARTDAGALANRQPIRVIVDSQNRTPADARVRDGAARTWVATAAELGTGADGRVDLRRLGVGLFERGCRRVLLEGGPTLAGAYLREGLVDEMVGYIAPKLLGDGPAALATAGIVTIAEAIDLEIVDVRRVGPDLRLSALPKGR